MPLVTSKELLQRAFEEHYAIGAFNAIIWNRFKPL